MAVFSLCTHMAEGAMLFSEGSYKGTNLIHEGSALMT